MNVKELIEKLKSIDENTEVVVYGIDGMRSVTQCDLIWIALNVMEPDRHEEVFTAHSDFDSYKRIPAIKLW